MKKNETAARPNVIPDQDGTDKQEQPKAEGGNSFGTRLRVCNARLRTAPAMLES